MVLSEEPNIRGQPDRTLKPKTDIRESKNDQETQSKNSPAQPHPSKPYSLRLAKTPVLANLQNRSRRSPENARQAHSQSLPQTTSSNSRLPEQERTKMQFFFQLQTICQMATRGDRSNCQLSKPANPSTPRSHCTIRPRTFQIPSGDRRCNLGSPTQPDLPRNKGTEAEQTMRLAPHHSIN